MIHYTSCHKLWMYWKQESGCTIRQPTLSAGTVKDFVFGYKHLPIKMIQNSLAFENAAMCYKRPWFALNASGCTNLYLGSRTV